MTTIFTREAVCTLCGTTSEQPAIGSTNYMGSPDLDGRAPPMARRTITYWLEECPRCGHVAPDLDSPVPEACRAAVRAAIPHAWRGEPDDPRRLFLRFQTRAAIAAALGDEAEQATRELHSAWVADDSGRAGDAVDARRRAAALLERLVGRGDAIDEAAEDGDDAAERRWMTALRHRMLVDALRRAGDWEPADEAARRFVEQVLPALPPPGPDEFDVAQLFSFMRARIAARDDRCFTLEEARYGRQDPVQYVAGWRPPFEAAGRKRRAHGAGLLGWLRRWLGACSVLATLGGPASAEEWVHRDADGRRVETLEERAGGGYVRRAPDRRRIGTIEPAPGGAWTLRDADGRRTGRVEGGFDGGLVIRDHDGRRIGTADPRTANGYVLRDGAGRRSGSLQRR